MIITLDLAGDVPIYQQIRDSVVAAIAQGKLREGDPLPSVRQLAVDIGVNMHTVNKAYALLKADGYLSIDRRSGARISERLLLDDAVRARIFENLNAAAIEAYSRGMTESEFLTLCESAFDQLKEEA
ncbi:GntR family transcriptional regulator [Oscillospiraceae bacterium PP1C4]